MFYSCNTDYKQTGNSSVPIGTIVAFGLKSIPPGWLLCDVSSINAKYQQLISALCSNNTPNLAGRTLIGMGLPNNGTQSDGSTPNFNSSFVLSLNNTGGEFVHTLTEDEMPKHRHSLQYKFDLSSDCHSGSGSMPCASGTVQYTDSTGGNQPHINMQPYQVVNYIIYTGSNE